MRLVFSLTAGRTGSRSLAGVLGANLPAAHVHHERLGPDVRGAHTPSVPLLMAFNEFGYTADVASFWRRKWAAVRSVDAETWVETSHLLLKAGLVEGLEDWPGERPEVHLIALNRDRKSLLRSFARLGDFHRAGNRQMWYLNPPYQRNFVQADPRLRASAVGLALWYIVEMEVRVAWARRQAALRGWTVHALQTDQLADPTALAPIVASLRGIDAMAPEDVATLPPLNTNPSEPLGEALEAEVEALAEQVAGFDADAHLDAVLRRRRQPFAASQVRPLRAPGEVVGSRLPEAFIASPGRSGSTLLVDLLGCHPDLTPIYETSVLPELIEAFGRRRAPAELSSLVQERVGRWAPMVRLGVHSKSEHERYVHGPHHLPMTVEDVLEAGAQLSSAVRTQDKWLALQGFVRALFDRGAERHGTARWINKTPGNIASLPLLLGIFPDARFLVTVRDPRAVALSVLPKPWGPAQMEQVPTWWKQLVLPGLMAWRMAPERVRFVRYEDLVAAPARTLRGALQHLGLNPDAAPILDRYSEAGLTLDPGRLSRWRGRLTPAQLALFDRALSEELDRFGYPPAG